MKILTINEAFENDHFILIEDALFALNRYGIYDSKFLPEVQKHIKSRQAQFNFVDLDVAPQVQKFLLV